MSTLSESSLRALLPQRGQTTTETQPSIAGTVVNSNPPASGPGDALIFDPDENITYDPLQTMTRTNDVPQAPQITINRMPSRNVIDVDPAPPQPNSGFGMGFWFILVAILLILSFVAFLFMRSSSSPQQASQVSNGLGSMDQFYGR